MKLRTNLFFMVLGTVLPFLALAVFLVSLLVSSERESNRRAATDRIRAFMTAVDAELRGTIGTLQALATSQRLKNADFRAFRREALDVLASQPDWISVTLMRSTGEQVINTALPEGPQFPTSLDPATIKQAVETRKFVIGNVTRGRVIKELQIAVRVPIFIDGDVRYVLSAAIRMAPFQRLIGEQQLQQGWEIGLVDSMGHFIAREPQVAMLIASEEFMQHARSASEGWYRGSTAGGSEAFTAHVTSPLSGWSAGQAIPVRQIDAPAMRATAVLGAGTLAVVVLVFAFAYWMGRRITAPVAALASWARSLGRSVISMEKTLADGIHEQTSVAAPPKSNVEEFQTLDQALSESAERLRSEFVRRDRAEDALRTSEQRFRALMTASSDVLYRMSPDWSEMRQLSEGFLAGTEAPTRNWLQKYIPQDEQSHLMATINDAIRIKSVFELEHRVRRVDGSAGWTFSRAIPLQDANGNIVEWFGAASDVTQRKRAEEALQAARTSAERATADAERANQAKDHFLAVLSHELRTPLTPVLAAVQLMQRKADLNEELHHHLEIVQRNVQLEARLIDDLLDLTRIVRGKFELTRNPINICTVIERAVEICKPDIDARQLHLAVQVKDAPHRVNGDVSRLQQVIWNLLTNAVKFTPKGGCIALRCYREGRHVIIEVSDSGIGIERAAIPRIFNAFEQAEAIITRQFGGLGLGLAIAKRLVALHGGTLSAHSEGKNQGSTFRVALPVSSAELVAETKKRTQTISETRKRLLLVEDNEDTAVTMKMLLEVSGYEVQTATDVAHALKAIESNEFHLLVSDLGLPDRSGIELMQELRRRGIPLKGIALTGYGQDEDIRRSKDAGFSSHLIKPVDADVLMETIARTV